MKKFIFILTIIAAAILGFLADVDPKIPSSLKFNTPKEHGVQQQKH